VAWLAFDEDVEEERGFEGELDVFVTCSEWFKVLQNLNGLLFTQRLQIQVTEYVTISRPLNMQTNSSNKY